MTRKSPRDEAEIRPPGRKKVFVEDFDEVCLSRYGRCWLHVEQMNDFNYYVAIYGAKNKRLHLSVQLGSKASKGKVEIITYENGLEKQ